MSCFPSFFSPNIPRHYENLSIPWPECILYQHISAHITCYHSGSSFQPLQMDFCKASVNSESEVFSSGAFSGSLCTFPILAKPALNDLTSAFLSSSTSCLSTHCLPSCSHMDLLFDYLKCAKLAVTIFPLCTLLLLHPFLLGMLQSHTLHGFSLPLLYPKSHLLGEAFSGLSKDDVSYCSLVTGLLFLALIMICSYFFYFFICLSSASSTNGSTPWGLE